MSDQDVLRERIARALLKFPLNDCHCPASSPCGRCAMASEEMSDAVIADLGLEFRWVYGWSCLDEGAPCPQMVAGDGACEHRYRSGCWATPWERIEEGG